MQPMKKTAPSSPEAVKTSVGIVKNTKAYIAFKKERRSPKLSPDRTSRNYTEVGKN